MTGNIVCLINRAPYVLDVKKDGKNLLLQPGENYVTSDWVRFAKGQHPVPGTQNMHNPFVTESLVAVKGSKDPCDPISQDILDMLPEEKIDRSTLSKDLQKVSVTHTNFPKGRMGMEAPTAGILEGAFGRND